MLIIECTVNGTSHGTTTWRGDSEVFVCHAMEITLLHHRFTTNKDDCNNGSVHVVGKGLKVEGNQYTSQLNVTLKENMIGKTIECYYEGGGQTLIDSVTINTTGNMSSVVLSYGLQYSRYIVNNDSLKRYQTITMSCS